MSEFVIHADDIYQQQLRQAVFAHYRNRLTATFLGQFQVPVTFDRQQVIALHTGHRLTDSRSALLQALSDPGT